MKAKNFFQRFVYGCLVAAMPWACAYQSAIGHEAMKDVSKEISELRSTIVSVEVYIVPGGVAFRQPLTERDVLQIACRRNVVTANHAAVSGLVNVLENARLVEAPIDKSEYDHRIVIRLHRSDSRVHTLALSRDYIGLNAHGEYRTGTESSPGPAISVEATNGIEKALRAWAEQHQALAANYCRR